MSKPVVFENAGFAKTLRGSLNLNDTCKIIQGDPNPQSSAVDAPRGSIYMRTGASGGTVYVKLDNGSSTNWQTVGSGSSGGVNYITNTDFEVATTGWATYADAAGASPVDGTGGSANVTLTLTPSSPLRGTQSGLFTKDAANRQGQGISYDFTISKADKAKPLKVSFDYLADTGTFAAGSDSTVGDVVVYLYDVTNAVVIQPTPYKLTNGSTTIPGQFQGYFQTNSNSTSYRLILHVASTSASAYTIQLDNFFLGPDAIVNGVPSTDWGAQAWTPTGSWSTNTTYAGQWRRVGDTAYFKVYITLAGAPTAANLSVNLPSVLVADTAKLVDSATSDRHVVGVSTTFDSGVLGYTGHVGYGSTTSVNLFFDNGSAGATAEVSNTAPFVFGNADSVYMEFSLPIVGWSSNVQMSSDADTRIVAAKLNTSTTSLTASAETTVVYNTTEFDTHGMASGGNTFKIPVPGKYRIAALHSASSGANVGTADRGMEARIFKNGTLASAIGAFGWQVTGVGIHESISGSVLLDLKANDTIQLKIFHNTSGSITVAGAADAQWLSIERLSGPATIAANELVAARYSTASTQTINTTDTIIDFDTKDFDSHSAVTTGASWKFTAPSAGKYEVEASMFHAAARTEQYLLLYKGGVLHQYLGANVFTSAISRAIQGKGTINLLADEQIDVRAQLQVSSNTLTSNATLNWVSVKRVGF